MEKSGLQAFYPSNADNQEVSKKYCNIMVQSQLKQNWKSGTTNSANFYVLNKVKCPAVLLELGFLSNLHEAKILSNSEKPNQYCSSNT